MLRENDNLEFKRELTDSVIKEIIIIEVLRGTNRPYYIKSKGMTIDGVFM